MDNKSDTLHTLVMGILTGSTCGFACWEAREDVCRCSCGGANHGILKRGGDMPKRTSKIDGYFYVLDSIGGEWYDRAQEVNRGVGYKSVSRVSDDLTYHYHWSETDKGAPARAKPATESQMKWQEVQPFIDPEHTWQKPYLVWIRDDSLDPARKDKPLFVRGKKMTPKLTD